MKSLICLVGGHSWQPWELIHYLNFKRTGKITGAYLRWCPRCHAFQWKTVVAKNGK